MMALAVESLDVGLRAADLWTFDERFFSSAISVQVIMT